MKQIVRKRAFESEKTEGRIDKIMSSEGLLLLVERVN